MFRSIDAYRGESPLAAWIYGIARNTVNHRIRRAAARRRQLARAQRELLRAGVATPPGTPEDALQLQRSLERIGTCLASVSGWQAEAFALRHLEDLPIEEIARRTSRSRAAVRSSLYRVKASLIAALGPRAANPERSRAAAQPSAPSAAQSAAAGSHSAGSRGARRPM